MKLSTRVRYGSRAILDLALHGNEGPVPLEVLAREQQIPERYLSKIIQDLRRSGLIQSVRGAGGGYLLNHPASEITMLDIWDALEGPFCPVECLAESASCAMEDECVTRDVWAELQEEINKLLCSVTLRELVSRYREKTAVAEAGGGSR
ncbi:MAG: Rrf2 family transcriptional regulator [Candidatus Brocadiaceae bacterium]|jgi:Rrf2 family protein